MRAGLCLSGCLVVLGGAALLVGCAPKVTPEPEGAGFGAAVKDEGGEVMSENKQMGELRLTSSAFAHEGAIPAKYTCRGEDISPPLSWTGVPEGTKSLVLIVDDPDAPDPDAPKMTWVHWVLYDIPPSATALDEGVKTLPAGAKAAVTNFEKTEYGGPCPPIGRHRYFHKLYALDALLPELPAPTKDTILAAMEGHVLARTELMGTYEKTR